MHHGNLRRGITELYEQSSSILQQAGERGGARPLPPRSTNRVSNVHVEIAPDLQEFEGLYWLLHAFGSGRCTSQEPNTFCLFASLLHISERCSDLLGDCRFSAILVAIQSLDYSFSSPPPLFPELFCVTGPTIACPPL
jgi:hypothetical protein